jgi:hypothetical protein
VITGESKKTLMNPKMPKIIEKDITAQRRVIRRLSQKDNQSSLFSKLFPNFMLE